MNHVTNHPQLFINYDKIDPQYVGITFSSCKKIVSYKRRYPEILVNTVAFYYNKA